MSSALAEAPTVVPEPPQSHERPPRACLLCPPPRKVGAWRLADEGYRTCAGCLDRLRDTLREVAARWAALDPAPGGQGEHGGRGAPGFGSRSPGSDHVIAMRDDRSGTSMAEDATVYEWDPLADDVLESGQYGPPRGAFVAKRRGWRGADGKIHRESERPPLPVRGELGRMAFYIAEARDMTGPKPWSVTAIVAWLDGQLDWVTRQDGVGAFAATVRELAAQLRPMTGEPGARKIGQCPNVIDEGEHTRECGADLRAPLRGDEIRCRACARRWPREEWLALGRTLQVA